MKNLMLFFTLVLFAGSFQASAGTPIEKVVPVEHVFVPNGFDSNDSVEVIVKGFLPNLCHKSPKAKVEIDGTRVNITLTSLFYHETNPFCPEMVVPFVESVKLGVLDKGNYDIRVNEKSPWEIKDNIKVNESVSNSINEFSYAYVDYIEKEDAPQGYVKFKGYNPSDCFELAGIEYIHNKKDTYSIMPKMRQVRDFCPMKLVPFEYEWKVPNDLDKNEVLLHVRTMEGNSINALYHK